VASGSVATWADVDIAHSLIDGDLPMPRVVWRSPQWALTVSVFADGSRERSGLLARYEIENLTSSRVDLTLALAARPYQVNPPAQFLNTIGGVSAIHDITWDGAALLVDGQRSVHPFPAPDRVGTFSFGAGPVAKILANEWPEARSVHDWDGFASAV